MNSANDMSQSQNTYTIQDYTSYRTKFMADLIEKYKDMSLEHICEEIEEEQTQEMTERQRQIQERRQLFALGHYELEEGEILE